MNSSHILSARQFTPEQLTALFREAKYLENLGRSSALQTKVMTTLFYEPSTRTRLSFESAMIHLGGQVISTENAKEFSSAIKGESIEDTIRVVENYADFIVLRHSEQGAAERAAAVSSVPIINAGDGAGEHPTQALLDVYTIIHELGTIQGKHIALMGDLAHGRTARSLAYLLSHFQVGMIYFIAPKGLEIGKDVKDFLADQKIPFQEETDMTNVLEDIDVLYQTRLQKERLANARAVEFEQIYTRYIIDEGVLARMRPRSIVMHPLPRVDEITKGVDSDSRAAYFRQARNGLYVRMALLKMIDSGEWQLCMREETTV